MTDDIKLTAPKASKDPVKDNLLSLLIVGITLIVLMTFNAIFHPVRVSGESMYPTLTDGEWLKCSPAKDADINVGDIVIFRDSNGKPLIKRVVGIPGETLTVQDGYIYADGEKRDAESIPEMEDPGVLTDGITLQKDEYFCCGDNRNASRDCRVFGAIKKSQITFIADSRLFGGVIESEEDS
jgi:signal peptidase I